MREHLNVFSQPSNKDHAVVACVYQTLCIIVEKK
jgi:hypothetical protein